MKKKNETNSETNSETNTNIRNEVEIIFKNSYIGKLGCFYSGEKYTIPIELYSILKLDCEKI